MPNRSKAVVFSAKPRRFRDVDLRPLSIAQIFDRAVDLTVRSLRSLVAVQLVYAIPFAFFRFFVSRDSLLTFERVLDGTGRFGGHLPGSGVAPVGSLGPSHAQLHLVATIVVFAGSALLAPIVSAALIETLIKTYFGGALSFADAYRVGVRRGIGIIGPIYGAVERSAFGVAAPAVKSIVLGLGAATAVVAGSVGTVAYGIAAVAVVVEGRGPRRAITRAMRLLWGWPSLRRALTFAVALLGCYAAFAAVLGGGIGLVLMTTHRIASAFAFQFVVENVALIVLFAVFVVYYLDARIRREGLDLTLSAAVLQRTSAAAEG